MNQFVGPASAGCDGARRLKAAPRWSAYLGTDEAAPRWPAYLGTDEATR